MIKRLNEQHTEAEELRSQIIKADGALLGANKAAQTQLKSVLSEQKQRAANERTQLLEKMTQLVNISAEESERRLDQNMANIMDGISQSTSTHEREQARYKTGMETWKQKSKDIVNNVLTSRETVKSKIKGDWTAANKHTDSLRNTTTSVHDETIRIVDAQMAHLETQLSSLDEIVSRVRAQNESHHATHTDSLATLSSSIQESYDSIGSHLETSYERVKGVNNDMVSQSQDLQDTLPSLNAEAQIRTQLKELRDKISGANMTEYSITGETPQKIEYTYPSTLPHTEAHDKFLAKLRGEESSPEKPPATSNISAFRSPKKPNSSNSPSKSRPGSPIKPKVFADTLPIPTATPSSEVDDAPMPPPTTTTTGLRELDLNVVPATITHAHPTNVDTVPPSDATKQTPPLPHSSSLKKKRQTTMIGEKGGAGVTGESRLPMTKKAGRKTVAAVGVGEGRENQGQGLHHGSNLGTSTGPGGNSGGGGSGGNGRVLRARDRGSD